MWLIDRMKEWRDRSAILGQGRATYRDILRGVDNLRLLIMDMVCRTRSVPIVASIEGDFSLLPCAALLTYASLDRTIVPLTHTTWAQHQKYKDIAGVGLEMSFFENGGLWAVLTERMEPPLITSLGCVPGLVLFSSGSTGEPKAILHNLSRLMDRHKKRRRAFRTLTFLLYDHIGGINTLLYTFANGGTIVTVKDRNPDTVCAAIEKHKVQLLPTSPTFLNLMLASGAHKRHDLSSLEVITYGTEPMPAHTLRALVKAFPDVRLKQTYGTTELGILGTRSMASCSRWMQVGGEGYETKIQNGTLWVRGQTSMVGYLNAPSPFDKDGWMDTGDAVIQDGDHLIVLGRESEVINVGGQKVYPAEVENVLLEMEGVQDVAAYGIANSFTGQVVAARVVLSKEEDVRAFKIRMRTFCQSKLETYKVPVKVEFVDAVQNERYKKVRR